MKNKFSLSRWSLAALILALVFLALALGTAGSVRNTGGSYELIRQGESDGKTPAAVFHLTDASGSSDGRDLYVKEVYVNVGAIYGEPGVNATLRLARGTSSASSYYNYVDVSVANLYTVTGEENVKRTANDLNNWVAFPVAEGGWRLSTYPYYRLTTLEQNVLINEIVFIGNTSENSLSPVVLKAEIDQTSELPYDEEEGKEAALKEAGALVDAQYLPSAAQSSFFRFTPEENFTLLSIAEMRRGDSFIEGDVYNADRVYNSLGTDIVALGTLIAGNSPFGLRLMPVLASFGILVLGYLLVRKMFASEKAGFVFAVLYFLCGMGFSLGHLGTPLMIGVFFFVAAFYFCYRYFADGLKKATFGAAAPCMLAGIFTAAAICVNGAFVIPALGIVALFLAGYVRHRREAQAELDSAIDEAEAEESAPAALAEGEASEGRKKAAKALGERNFKNSVSVSLFFSFLVFGAFLISMLASLPLYYTYLKLYDNPVAPSGSIFSFLWQAFIGGFAGVNDLGTVQSPFTFFYELFRGTGSSYAVTATGILASCFALAAGVAGIVLVLIRLAKHIESEDFNGRLTAVLIPAVLVVLSIATALFAKGGLAFLLTGALALFILAADAVQGAESEGESKTVKILSWVFLALTAVWFILFAVFTFSVPLSAGLMTSIVG